MNFGYYNPGPVVHSGDFTLRHRRRALARRQEAWPPGYVEARTGHPGFGVGMVPVQQDAFPQHQLVPGERAVQQRAFNPGCNACTNPAYNPGFPGAEYSGYLRFNPEPGEVHIASARRAPFLRPPWQGMRSPRRINPARIVNPDACCESCALGQRNCCDGGCGCNGGCGG